jgi:hypothetical protein
VLDSQGLEDGCGAWRGDRGGGDRTPGEKDRLPSMGGGESALFVSGDWAWYGAKSMARMRFGDGKVGLGRRYRNAVS